MGALIRGFADGNGDGIGGLRGMIGRLDHLAWLGVDCSVEHYCGSSPRITIASAPMLTKGGATVTGPDERGRPQRRAPARLVGMFFD